MYCSSYTNILSLREQNHIYRPIFVSISAFNDLYIHSFYLKTVHEMTSLCNSHAPLRYCYVLLLWQSFHYYGPESHS